MTNDTKSMKYMVYISFHKGEDTIRYSFLSHLSASLHRKGLISSSSLLDKSSKGIKTEKNSFKAFVVVISGKYVLSPECLDELSEIVDHQENNQNLVVVVPVFYCITKSEVVHQSRLHILRDTFSQENYSDERVARWIGALKRTTDSYESRRTVYGECELVEDIAREVYEKMFPSKRIGTYSRLLELENFVYKQPWGVRSVGIWGMPGIGKTTLVKAALAQFTGDYEGSCFIKDFDKELRAKGIYHLLKEYVGKTLKKEHDTNNSFMKSRKKRLLIVLDNVHKPLDVDAFLNGFDWFGPGSLIIITSRDKQVLVQCGVHHIYEVQGLNEDEAMQLFHRCAFGIDWRKKSGLEILSLSLMSVIEFCSGNPLALRLYGKMLSHKKPNEMETKFFMLKLPPTSTQIMEVFKSSYNALNENEKTMFLDIACFFRGENVDYVMQLFEGCGFFPHIGIYVLVDKCLVKIIEKKMQMHNLIQVIGKEISNKEILQLERHVRLWDASIIQPLLEDEETKLNEESKGAEDIEGIFLDISHLDFFVKPNAFKSMHHLRFLKIYSFNAEKHQGLRFHKALEFLPNELRLLHWEYYPLKSLPQHFDPSHLVELNMPYSQLQKLWGGTKNLNMLKTIRLGHSQELVEIEDFLNAQNIEVIDLQGCTRIQSFPDTSHLQHLRVINLSGCVEIKSSDRKEIQCFPRNLKELYLSETTIRRMPSSISHLTALDVLDLTNCKRFQDLPMGMSNLTSLVKLMLSGCSELEDIQDLPTNLKELYVAETAIREVPSSICHLTQLLVFDAANCKKLQDLPLGMDNLNSLTMLTLSGCSNLRNISDLPQNLKILNLADTSVKKLPSSFENLTKLVSLDLSHCKRLQYFQVRFFESVVRVELSGCSKLEYILGLSLQDITQLHTDGTDKVMLHGTPSCNVILILEKWRTVHVTPRENSGSKVYLRPMPFVSTPYRSKLSFSLVLHMFAMVSLFLSNACPLDMHIPQEICDFLSLKTLDLCGNGFSKLPESVKKFRNLESLILCHCKNLESLPELPQSLELLNAHGCVSLKNIQKCFQQIPRHCTFSNCFNISPHFVKEILDASVAHMVRERTLQKVNKTPVFSFSVPALGGGESIFHLQQGSSVKMHLTPLMETFLGFRISVVVAFWNDSYNAAGFGIRCVCRWENKKGLSRQLERIFYCWKPKEVAQKVRKNHMFIFCDVSMHLGGTDGNDLDILDDLVVFEFLPVNGQNMLLDDSCTITECGVDVITTETDKTSLALMQPAFVLLPPYKKRKRDSSGSQDIEMEYQRLIISETKQVGVPKQSSLAHKSSVSSSSLVHRQKSNQVFLSFCEDVRRTFVSYLIKEFKWIGITAVYSGFMGGKSMSHPEVTQAIKESSISVVVLSKNYVSSRKCLNELVEILQWREETLGNKVIPIYYEVDIFYVRKLTKNFGKGLVETNLGKVEKPELRWMIALTYIVDIVGEFSQDWDDEGEMIEKIAVYVSNQVNIMGSNEVRGLLIDKENENIEDFKRIIRDDLLGVSNISVWYLYTFSLLCFFLFSLRSRLIL